MIGTITSTLKIRPTGFLLDTASKNILKETLRNFLTLYSKMKRVKTQKPTKNLLKSRLLTLSSPLTTENSFNFWEPEETISCTQDMTRWEKLKLKSQNLRMKNSENWLDLVLLSLSLKKKMLTTSHSTMNLNSPSLESNNLPKESSLNKTYSLFLPLNPQISFGKIDLWQMLKELREL